MLGGRGWVVEHAVARICPEAGGRVTTNVLVKELDVGPHGDDARKLEVVADGSLMFQFLDTSCDGDTSPPREAEWTDDSDFGQRFFRRRPKVLSTSARGSFDVGQFPIFSSAEPTSLTEVEFGRSRVPSVLFWVGHVLPTTCSYPSLTSWSLVLCNTRDKATHNAGAALDLVCFSSSSPLTVRVHDGDNCQSRTRMLPSVGVRQRPLRCWCHQSSTC